ncbi:MAG: DUF3078 domain-containing protein [Fibrobacterota bacterium]
MKTLLLLSLTIAVLAAADAEHTWNLTANSNFTVSQAYFSDNWDGSERGNISWLVDFRGEAEKDISDIVHTKNTLRIEYGQTKRQDEDRSWDDFQKNSDKIEFESLFRFSLAEFADPFVSVNAASQFTDQARDAEIEGEDLLNPKYDLRFNPIEVTESFGLARRFLEEENAFFDARFGGALKQTYRRWELQEDFTYDDDFISEAGLEFVALYEAQVNEDLLDYRSELNIFTPLAISEEFRDENEDWKVPVITWDNNLTMNVTDYIVFRFGVDMLYNKTIDEDFRIRQNMGLGINFLRTNN